MSLVKVSGNGPGRSAGLTRSLQEAVVQNGVWVRQDTAFDSPLNMGAHCAKGASVAEHGHGEHRLRYPMKLVDGKYQRISWEQAINEVGDRLLQIREKSGQDAVFWIGSSKYNNEQAYLMRKFVSMWGTNNTDHQARICPSTTVAGVAQTYGFGAMTNSFNDLHGTKAVLFIGSNPSEAHPISMLHFLHAKEHAEGAGGTPSGAAMGGTTGGAAATQAPPQ